MRLIQLCDNYETELGLYKTDRTDENIDEIIQDIRANVDDLNDLEDELEKQKIYRVFVDDKVFITSL